MPVTIRDLAKATGYSVSTVSKVLNQNKGFLTSEGTRNRIFATAKELGYEPNFYARGMSGKKRFLIGIAGSFFSSEVVATQMREILSAPQLGKYSILMSDTQSDPKHEEMVIDEFRKKMVDGLILRTITPYAEEELLKLLPADIPCLVISNKRYISVPNLTMDHEQAMYEAAERLLKMGHSRISFITTGLDSNQAKFLGYRRALERYGVFDTKLVLEMGVVLGAAREFAEKRQEFFRELDAVMCSDDRLAMETIKGLQAGELAVPRNLSVTGFDDVTAAALFTPTLSTLRQPQVESAKKSAEMLMAMLAGEKVENAVFVPEFIMRESVSERRIGK